MTRLLGLALAAPAVALVVLVASEARAEKVLCQQSSFWVGDYVAVVERSACPAESVVDADELGGAGAEPEAAREVECKLEDWLGTSKDGYAWCRENGGRYCVAQVIGHEAVVMGCQKPFQRRPHYVICCG